VSAVPYIVGQWAWLVDDSGRQISVLVRYVEELDDGYTVTFENMQTGDTYRRRYRTGEKNESTDD
jgi:arginyl-tRNA synthetase